MYRHWFIFCMYFFSLYSQDNKFPRWTWRYKKLYPIQNNSTSKQKDQVILKKTDIPNFTQLILSWNAFEPEFGHYEFFVQVRNAKTKKWYPWHKMIEWGNKRQCSYLDSNHPESQYHYVRLEVLKGNYADALRVKVIPQKGANISLLKGVAITTANYQEFTSENLAHIYKLPSVYIKNVPTYSQFCLDHPKKDVICSPTSCSMVVNYFNKQNSIDPIAFADDVFDSGLNAYGSWPFNTAQAFLKCNGKVHFWVSRSNSFCELYAHLLQNMPVVVSVRGKINGAPKEYPHGHLLVVIGWDQKNKKVLCHDPAFSDPKEVFVSYPVKDFLTAWERSRRLIYLPEKRLI